METSSLHVGLRPYLTLMLPLVFVTNRRLPKEHIAEEIYKRQSSLVSGFLMGNPPMVKSGEEQQSDSKDLMRSEEKILQKMGEGLLVQKAYLRVPTFSLFIRRDD